MASRLQITLPCNLVRQLRYRKHINYRLAAVRTASSDSKKDVEESRSTLNVSLEKPQTTTAVTNNEESTYFYVVERFVPVTRRALVRHIYQDTSILSITEKNNFDNFAVALEAALTNRSHRMLEELKELYDGLDPDKDTKAIRRLSRNELLNNEFWLTRQISHLLEKANFYQLPSKVVEESLREHKVDGVSVTVDTSKYDIMHFWARGLEKVHDVNRPWYSRLYYDSYYKFFQISPPKQYRRVLAILRHKSEKQLTLKVFKDVPNDRLQAILPDCTIKMGKGTRRFIALSIAISGGSLLAKSVAVLAEYAIVDTVWIAAAVAGIMALNGYNAYINRRNSYLVRWSSMLYYENIANNRGVLALLTDRANDETVKEALLVYLFLLNNNMPKSSSIQSGLSIDELENQLSHWLNNQFKINVQFDASDAIKHLKLLGIVQQDNKIVTAVPLEQAINLLQSVSSGGPPISQDFKSDDTL